MGNFIFCDPDKHKEILRKEKDYEKRLVNFSLTPKDEIQYIVKNNEKVVFLDVRPPSEILSQGKLQQHSYINIQLPYLKDHASNYFPDKNGMYSLELKNRNPIIIYFSFNASLLIHHFHTITNNLVPIIAFCAVGYRSGIAKKELERLGYLNVYNAGGVHDIL